MRVLTTEDKPKTQQMPAWEPATSWWLPKDSVSERRLVSVLAKMVQWAISREGGNDDEQPLAPEEIPREVPRATPSPVEPAKEKR